MCPSMEQKSRGNFERKHSPIAADIASGFALYTSVKRFVEMHAAAKTVRNTTVNFGIVFGSITKTI